MYLEKRWTANLHREPKWHVGKQKRLIEGFHELTHYGKTKLMIEMNVLNANRHIWVGRTEEFVRGKIEIQSARLIRKSNTV